jgi:hypothetical protein
MEYTQSLAIWMTMKSVMASIREHGIPAQANRSQPEEGFVPFNLPPLPQQGHPILHPAAEARPPVALAPSASHVQSTS